MSIKDGHRDHKSWCKLIGGVSDSDYKSCKIGIWNLVVFYFCTNQSMSGLLLVNFFFHFDLCGKGEGKPIMKYFKQKTNLSVTYFYLPTGHLLVNSYN